MNRQRISRKAGRELDRDVAIKVMGVIWLKHLLQFSAELAVKWMGTTADREQSGGVYVPVEKESEMISLKVREKFDESVPPYSTDINAARQVIEQMKKRGYAYIFEEKMEQEGPVYYGRFVKDGIDFGAGTGCRLEAEAIVKAALTALA